MLLRIFAITYLYTIAYFMLLHILCFFPATNKESPYFCVLINRKGVANHTLDKFKVLKEMVNLTLNSLSYSVYVNPVTQTT